ncbi:MAG TPA: gliding motility-associated C-terminal domain-containing protein, partial [Flavobacteriales bacterium]|nr:gliding motility-associated C-terminal domain-containing protein [Flavobacteriales bacterium]
PAGTYTVLWNTGAMGTSITADTSGTYWCQAVFLQNGNNLLTNGDFHLGAVGFTSDLTAGGSGANGPLTNAGTYGVSADASTLNNTFAACADHTGGGGNMFVANGNTTAGLNAWCATVNVQPNTDYAFSAWIASLTATSPAVLAVSVNGNALGTPMTASGTTCQWDQFFGVWNSGASTSATICITDQNVDDSGNDFALDDLAFAALCAHRDSIQVTVLTAPPQVQVIREGSLCPGDEALLHAVLDPAGWPAPVDYLWNTQASTQTIAIDAAGFYDVTASGPCLSAQSSILVQQDTCSAALIMPNVFTPNDDGNNDTFGPIVVGAPTGFVMDIRNRWGQVVYHSELLGDRWTGRSTAMPDPEGTYFWVVRYVGRTLEGAEEQREEAGYVMLRR